MNLTQRDFSPSPLIQDGNDALSPIGGRTSFIPNTTSLETPGPGHYIGNTNENGHPQDIIQIINKQKRTTKINFGNYSRRETDAFIKRDVNQPFKDQTSYNES